MKLEKLNPLSAGLKGLYNDFFYDACFITTQINLVNPHVIDSIFIRRRRLGFGRSHPESGQKKKSS